MGTSHFTSNVAGNVKITVASVNATNLKIGTKIDVPNISVTTAVTTAKCNSSTEASSPKVKAHSYLQLGTNQYMFFGNSGKSATIVAEATALVATPIKGSIYISTRGELWVYTSNAAASPLTGTHSNP